jgi:hypothetical protein
VRAKRLELGALAVGPLDHLVEVDAGSRWRKSAKSAS